MKILRLILREALHRRGSSLLALLSVMVATACVTGTVTLLRLDDVATERLLATKRQAVEVAGAELEDAMRKITKGLGFNILILPEGQDLGELHLEGTLTRTMPEEYADRLARSGIVTVNHLLPTVVRKIPWPEQGFPVILQGTRGEVPLLHADPKQPLLEAVPPGAMVLGAGIHQRLEANPGDTLQLRGRTFVVSQVFEERGTPDDFTVWVHLGEAQALLGMENLIHAILALECHCAGDRISAIRQEITQTLPGVQVIERGPPALARAEARNQAHETAVWALKTEAASRTALKQQHEQVAGWLVPGALIAAMVWIGASTFGNARERRAEIGVLRALGFRTRGVLGLFVGRALLLGALGGLVGAGVGIAFIGRESAGVIAPEMVVEGSSIMTLGLGLGVAVALSVIGSWLPAFWAARRDPAVLLQPE